MRFASSDPHTDFKAFSAASEMNPESERLDNDFK